VPGQVTGYDGDGQPIVDTSLPENLGHSAVQSVTADHKRYMVGTGVSQNTQLLLCNFDGTSQEVRRPEIMRAYHLEKEPVDQGKYIEREGCFWDLQGRLNNCYALKGIGGEADYVRKNFVCRYDNYN
ncbi:hypothetical protein N8343_08350, partial [Akkermansiaceae bacterium]|nr:hypothetical protein [Akkermansiaceae bacterium]